MREKPFSQVPDHWEILGRLAAWVFQGRGWWQREGAVSLLARAVCRQVSLELIWNEE